MMCGAQIMIHINISSLSIVILRLFCERTSQSDVYDIYSSYHHFPRVIFSDLNELTDHLPGPGGKLNKIRVSSIWALVISVV